MVRTSAILPWAGGVLIALLLAGCSPPAPASDATGAVRVEDASGRTLVLPAPPLRVVSLVPSVTELVERLAGPERLVGRTRYDRSPTLAHLPSLGGGLDPNLEALAALRPDLVLVSPDEDARGSVARLETLGIRVFGAATGTMEELRQLTSVLGQVLGPPADERARHFLDSLDIGLDELQRASAGLPRPTVFYLVWNDPPITVGPGTYLDDVITAAGALNLFHDAGAPWPQVSLEEILRRQPDWVILTDEQAGGDAPLRWIRGAPGWRELRAVREGRVAVVEADLFNRPGPRVLEATRALAALLHGEAAQVGAAGGSGSATGPAW